MSKRSNSELQEKFHSHTKKRKELKKNELYEYDRFEDRINLLENMEKERLEEKRKKKSAQDVQDFEDFYAIDHKNILKLYNYDEPTEGLNPVFNLSHRQHNDITRGVTMNFSDLLAYFFDDYVLDSLIEFNVGRCLFDLPAVMYGTHQGNLHAYIIFFLMC